MHAALVLHRVGRNCRGAHHDALASATFRAGRLSPESAGSARVSVDQAQDGRVRTGADGSNGSVGSCTGAADDGAAACGSGERNQRGHRLRRRARLVLANHQALELHGMPPASMPFDEWGAYYEARWPGGVAAALGGAAAVTRLPGRDAFPRCGWRSGPALGRGADGRREGDAAARRRRAADRRDVDLPRRRELGVCASRRHACAARSPRTWPRA